MERLTPEQVRNLVQKIIKSDPEAFDNLFRFLYPRLVRFTCRFVQNKATAGDIVQDAFVTLWEKRRTLDPNRSVKAYLYRTVRNRSLNYLRDHSEERIGLHSIHTTHYPSIEEKEPLDNPDNRLVLLKKWINDLPERQRRAFVLSRFEGLDHQEIAYVMKVSPNTVNNHIVAALNHLRDRYDEYQNEINNA